MIIKAESLVKTYKSGDSFIKALNNVNVQIDEGEMVAIMGTSGSGKSTFMNILGCLDSPDSGKYILAGDDVSKLSIDQLAVIRNRRIGFVFQSFNLLPRMSALENVELPLLYAGDSNAKVRAMETLEVVGLADRMHHGTNQLSGGQLQRVAIARAIIANPVIILADEPTGNLDTKTGEEIMSLFKTLNDRGKTIVIVTHDDEIAKQCKHKIHMRDGCIVN